MDPRIARPVSLLGPSRIRTTDTGEPEFEISRTTGEPRLPHRSRLERQAVDPNEASIAEVLLHQHPPADAVTDLMVEVVRPPAGPKLGFG